MNSPWSLLRTSDLNAEQRNEFEMNHLKQKGVLRYFFQPESLSHRFFNEYYFDSISCSSFNARVTWWQTFVKDKIRPKTKRNYRHLVFAMSTAVIHCKYCSRWLYAPAANRLENFVKFRISQSANHRRLNERKNEINTSINEVWTSHFTLSAMSQRGASGWHLLFVC